MVLAQESKCELGGKPRRWQWSLRSMMLTMTGWAIMLACVCVVPRIGATVAVIAGGVLGYYVSKPYGSVFAAWACGSIGGALLGALTGIVVFCIELSVERESYISTFGVTGYHKWAWQEGIAVIVMGGVLGGTALGGLVGGGVGCIKKYLETPLPSKPHVAPVGILRVYLYWHILATIYVAAMAYVDFYHLGFVRGPVVQSVCLILLLLSFGSAGAPFGMILAAIKHKVPIARCGPMIVAAFVLLLIQLLSLRVLC